MKGSSKNLLPVLLCISALGSSLAEICERPTIADCKRRKCRRIDPDLCNEIGGIYLHRGDNCKKCPVCMKRVGLNESCNVFEESTVSGNMSNEIPEARKQKNIPVKITQICHIPLFCSRNRRGKCVEKCTFRKINRRRKRRHRRKRVKTIKNDDMKVSKKKADDSLGENNKSFNNSAAVGSRTQSTSTVQPNTTIISSLYVLKNSQNFLQINARDTVDENGGDATVAKVTTTAYSMANTTRRKTDGSTIAVNASATNALEENASTVKTREANALGENTREVSTCTVNATEVSGREANASQINSCGAKAFTANARAENVSAVNASENSTSTGNANNTAMHKIV